MNLYGLANVNQLIKERYNCGAFLQVIHSLLNNTKTVP